MRTLFMLTAAVCAAACAEVKPWHTRSETTPSLRALIPAVPDASWTTNWWMGRHEAKMKEVRAGGAPIVFLGDSITHFWESNGRAVWDRYFATGRYRALNLGFSGDRTEHVLWRIAHGELDGYNAKAVSGRILTSQNVADFNDFQHPDIVSPKAYKDAKLKNGVLTVAVPAKSIVVLNIK